jgi:hypothetical protein
MDGPLKSARPPICVLGMGRSGTSLVARIVGLLGVTLGARDRMLAPVEGDNPTGYWEQSAVVELNEEILAYLGGAWDLPPALAPGWEHDPELDPFVERAQVVLREHFDGAKLWGWKDPRTTILLPLWRRVVGDLDAIVCVRDPISVARSLARRDPERYPFDKSVALWLHYSATALRQTKGTRRVIVFYDDWIDAPEDQLERVATFVLGAEADEPAAWRDQAVAFIDTALRHHRASVADVAASSELEPEIRTFYVALRQANRAGGDAAVEGLLPELDDAFRTRIRHASEHTLATERVSALENENAVLRVQVARQARELEDHQIWLDGMNSSLSWRITSPLRTAKRVAQRWS